jgi:hypothetical protein
MFEQYLARHATGRHATEAQHYLKAASAKLAVLKKQEEARSRVADSIQQLCTVVQQLSQLDSADRLQSRVDSASGTVNLYQRRQNATARVLLGDQKRRLQKEIAQVGVRFNRKLDCESDEE